MVPLGLRAVFSKCLESPGESHLSWYIRSTEALMGLVFSQTLWKGLLSNNDTVWLQDARTMTVDCLKLEVFLQVCGRWIFLLNILDFVTLY